MLGFVRRQSPASDLGTGLFGKIATASDFVSVGDYSPASGHLSKWLEEGVGWAATQAKADWLQLESMGPRAFVFSPQEADNGDRVVVGLLQPSRDAVGRRFPLAVYSELSLGGDGQNHSVIPLAAGAFLESAQGILSSAEGGQDPRPRLLRGTPGISGQLAQAKDEFSMWASGTPLSSVWDSLLGEGETARVQSVVANLIALLLPLRGQEGAMTPLAVRLPLGGAGVGGAVFWLDVIRRCLGWRRRMLCAFWHTYVGSGTIVVPLGSPQPRTLLGLWVADERDDSMCDLTGAVTAVAPIPIAVESAMCDGVTVSVFLDSLKM